MTAKCECSGDPGTCTAMHPRDAWGWRRADGRPATTTHPTGARLCQPCARSWAARILADPPIAELAWAIRHQPAAAAPTAPQTGPQLGLDETVALDLDPDA